MIFRPLFFFLLAGGIVLAVLGAFDPSFFVLIWPYNLSVLTVAIVIFWITPTARDLIISRKFDPVLSVRVPNLVILKITNDGRTKINCRLRDEPPPEFAYDNIEFEIDLYPGETKEFRYHVTPKERGDYFFRDSFVRVPGFLNIISRQSRINAREIVRVYPNILALRKFDLLKQRGHLQQIGIRRSRLKGVGTEFESLRDYAQGDDYRKIAWKASAKRGKPIVREYEAERSQSVILVIDYGRLMMADVEKIEKIDHVLDAALMLGHAAIAGNDQVGLLVYADRVERWIPPKRGRHQVGMVIEALHALRAEPLEPDSKSSFGYLASRWKRRSLIVVFSDIEEPETATELLKVLGPISKRHIVLVCMVSDPKVHSQLATPLDVRSASYLRGSALIYQSEREQAQRLLNHQGVHTLDAEPTELGKALVNYYLDVKAKALL